MTHIPITNLFNAYDLQVNPLDKDKIRSQEVVNYCEARFRVVLQAMMARSEKDQKWMYTILFREMVIITTLFHFLTLKLLILGIMFLTYRCGSCDWATAQHPSDYQVTRPGHVPSRLNARCVFPTRPRAHDLPGRQS
jgi:hypothetical protein